MDGFRFGRAVVALRRRRGWRQSDLADRAGLSRGVVGRAERGDVARIALGDLEAIAIALDSRLDLDLRWRGEGLDRLIDERHAAVVGETTRILRAARWDVDVEVSFSVFGERGSIDVFGRHPETSLVAVFEVKASVPDAGATVIGLDRKARLAPAIARERGWPCTGVARFLVVADGSTNRGRIDRHRAIFRTAFPAGGRQCLDWIRDPLSPPPSGILFVSPRDVRRADTPRRRTTVRPSPRAPSHSGPARSGA